MPWMGNCAKGSPGDNHARPRPGWLGMIQSQLHIMKIGRYTFALAASAAMLAAAFAGEISLPKEHIAVTLPDGWQRVPDHSAGILLRAQADSGQLRLIFTRPPVPMKSAPVQDAGFQRGVKQSLIDHGFVTIVRSQVIKVAGADAYLCEARRKDRPHSIMQVLWFHEGHSLSLVFLSLAKPFKDVPDVQAIIDSVKVLPKS